VIRAYQFALDPTEAQAEVFRSHCGAQRVAYNWCLAQVEANWAQRAAEQTYGLTGDQLTPWINTSAYSLRKAWNAAKAEVAPWWAENSKEAYASGCANLATALGNRKAGRARMPRFKSKHRSRLTCRFTTGACGLGQDRRHIQLPVIGLVRTHESTRKLARHIEAGSARIRSATLSYQRGRWHVALCVQLPDREHVTRTGDRVVGVDLGITHLAVLSTGEVVPNPRHLDGALRELRRTQRQVSRRRGPHRRTRTAPSRHSVGRGPRQAMMLPSGP
jgi:putative transposase